MQFARPQPPHRAFCKRGTEGLDWLASAQVIAWIRPAEAILLFGPGEAKGEFRRRVERGKLDLSIICFETAD